MCPILLKATHGAFYRKPKETFFRKQFWNWLIENLFTSPPVYDSTIVVKCAERNDAHLINALIIIICRCERNLAWYCEVVAVVFIDLTFSTKYLHIRVILSCYRQFWAYVSTLKHHNILLDLCTWYHSKSLVNHVHCTVFFLSPFISQWIWTSCF